MEQISQIITDGAISILVVLVGILFSHVREYLITKSKELQARTTNEQFSLAQDIAITVVQAVEQIFQQVDGKERFRQARQLLVAELKTRGIYLSDAQLETLIESAVKEMNLTQAVLLDELTR